MFCVKCGNQISENEQFCTNCGQPVGAENPSNDENVNSKSFEEKSAEIVSGVKDTVSNLAGKSAEFAEKVKKDEKINEAMDKAVDTVKSNKNTLIIAGGAIVAVVLILVLIFANISSPEKAVKGYFAGVKSKNFNKVLKNTDISDTLLNTNVFSTYDYEDIDMKEAKKDTKEDLSDLKDDFKDSLDGIKVDLKKVKLLVKTNNAAIVEVKYTITEDGDKETEEDYIRVVKEGNKWVVSSSSVDFYY